MKTFLSLIYRFASDEDGAAAVQYALLFALVAFMIASAASRLLPDIQSIMRWLLSIIGIPWF